MQRKRYQDVTVRRYRPVTIDNEPSPTRGDDWLEL